MEDGSRGETNAVYEAQTNTITSEIAKEDGCESGISSPQPQSACTSRTNSLNSEGDKTEKLLKILQFRNPGPQLATFNPDKSRREQRKVKQFLLSSSQTSSPEKRVKKYPRRRDKADKGRKSRNTTNSKRIRRNYHDRSGVRLSDNKDICDCQQFNCPGCHFPCVSCGSEKCGVECRCSRKWTYSSIIEIENPFTPKTEITGQE